MIMLKANYGVFRKKNGERPRSLDGWKRRRIGGEGGRMKLNGGRCKKRLRGGLKIQLQEEKD